MRTTLCARPGCAGPASAWLTYDYAAQQVWLDDQPTQDIGNRWGLCAMHASRLRAPRGWTELDRRKAELHRRDAELNRRDSQSDRRQPTTVRSS